MNIKKIVFIDRNFINDRYPNKPNDGDAFFTYGWGSEYARNFKKHNPDWHVECWKVDSRINEIKRKLIQDVEYIMFPGINLPLLGFLSTSIIKYFETFRLENKNVIYNIASFDHLLFYTLAIKMKGLQLVVQNHGESTLKYKIKKRNFFKNLHRFLLLPIEKKAFKNIKLLYLLDKDLTEWLPNKNFKIKVSTVGVDPEVFSPIDKKEARLKLNLDLNKKYLLYVGRLNKTKSPNMLIEVFNDLKKRNDNIELLLIGNHPNDEFYSMGIECGSIIKGVIPQTELKYWLSAADIYYLPKYSSNHSFGGIGMLPVQSILCNTPVIGECLKNFPEKDVDKVGIYATNINTIKNATSELLKINSKLDIRDYAIKYYSWENITKNSALDFLELLKKHEKIN